jgi:hypothetical protein
VKIKHYEYTRNELVEALFILHYYLLYLPNKMSSILGIRWNFYKWLLQREQFGPDIIGQAMTSTYEGQAHSEYANPLTVYSTEHSKLVLYPGT